MEVLEEILFERLGFHVIEPRTAKEERCLAKPALFQKMNEKLKEYKGGYLLPKREINSSYLKEKDSRALPGASNKVEYHPLVNFSLGIKLGLASVDMKVRYIAEEVAYWVDDMLDAVEEGKLVVDNKSKRKV